MSEAIGRGQNLVQARKRSRTTPGILARLYVGGWHRILDRIDQGLESGAIEATLPDGSQCILGGRAPGFRAIVKLHNWRSLIRMATSGSVGWYEAWEAGEWESPDPVQLFALFMANARTLGDTARAKGPWRWLASRLHARNRNSKAQAARNIHAHYDLGNDFYAAWLDPTMSYSSARFEHRDVQDTDALHAGQIAKWSSLADRLGEPGSLLEIGCGWGALAGHFAEAGWNVTAISISDSQLDWARSHQAARIDFRNQDYRDIDEQFDAIVSVEMVEAVGREYWPTYFDCIARCLKPGGRAAIQYITIADDLFDAYAASADFIQMYIFPGGMLVRERDFARLAAERGLAWQDVQHFPLDYAETLRIWRERFDLAASKGELPAGFDDRFKRLWRYYLMYCEGGFRSGGISVAQVTLVKE